LIAWQPLKQSGLGEPPQPENRPAGTGQLAGSRQHVPLTLELHWAEAGTPSSQKNAGGQLTLMVLHGMPVSFGQAAPDAVTLIPSWPARLSFQ
jgi:hypothetical protein